MRIGLALLAAVLTFAVSQAEAACWRTPNGQIIETQSNSTPPVAGARRVDCPAPTLRAPTGRYPLDGRITQDYGVTWSRNAAKTHTGVDISARRGTPVPSMSGGTVEEVVSLGNDDGRAVVVRESNGTARAYLHVDPSVRRGDPVFPGTIIGTVYRDHLHYNVCRRVEYCARGALPTNRPDPAYPNDPLFPGPFRRP
jgi:murein DD-endopeptidase MepM/ murein hydrolase activator NlpD